MMIADTQRTGGRTRRRSGPLYSHAMITVKELQALGWSDLHRQLAERGLPDRGSTSDLAHRLAVALAADRRCACLPAGYVVAQGTALRRANGCATRPTRAQATAVALVSLSAASFALLHSGLLPGGGGDVVPPSLRRAVITAEAALLLTIGKCCFSLPGPPVFCAFQVAGWAM